MSYKAFFAYPNQPRISDAVTAFAEKINAGALIKVETWEQMQIGGKVLVPEICKKINECDLFFADITRLNPNVLFEIGYAIARKKRIWLVRDNTIPADNSEFVQFRILTGLGYRNYVSSNDMIEEFYTDMPHESMDATVYDSAIAPAIRFVNNQHVLYLKSYYEDEASIKVTQYLDEESTRKRLLLLVDDPAETAIQPLAWYAANVHVAQAVICHLTAIERQDSKIQNAKHSLIAGMAHGFEIPVLLLMEGDVIGPADYRDLLYNYIKVKDAVRKVEQFTTPIVQARKQFREEQERESIKSKSIDELAMLKIGEPIAEHESDKFSEQAFVETAAYQEALDGSQSIFVGHKGVGKTANFQRISKVLSRDKRVFICEIKPLSYELAALVDVAKKFSTLSKRGFLFESLWKFLIYSELAKQTVQSIQERPSGLIFPHERGLVALVEAKSALLKLDFSARLDKLSAELLNSSLDDSQSAEASVAVSELLHAGIIRDLIETLIAALSEKIRVLILVDNLDKAWDRSENTKLLSYFFLGLLSASRRITNDFKNRPTGKTSLQTSLCAFVRADIFDMVLEVAREPDKLQYQIITWDDKVRLKLLADNRLMTAVGVDTIVPVSTIWKKFFVPTVFGTDVFEHMFSIILPRPRDLLIYLRASITSAVNRRHDKVTEDDFVTAEEDYSNFAYKSLVVELREKIAKVEDILSEFMGRPSTLSQHEIEKIFIGSTCCSQAEAAEIIESLTVGSFLEIGVPIKGFISVKDRKEYKRVFRAASNAATLSSKPVEFRIHRAFWQSLLIG